MRIKDSYVKKVLEIEENYFKKYGNNKRMSVEELRLLIEGKINKEKAVMKKKGIKYLTEKEALSKYK